MRYAILDGMTQPRLLGTGPNDVPLYLTPQEAGPAAIPIVNRTPEQLRRSTPGGSLIASAQRIKSARLSRQFRKNSEDWQQDAWDIFDMVGEQRFLSTTLAGRLAQARLFVGETNPETPERPEPVEDEQIEQLLLTLGGGSYGRLAQHLYRFAVNLFIAGEVWFVGIPSRLLGENAEQRAGAPSFIDIDPMTGLRVGDDIDDLEWRALSSSEWKFTAGGNSIVQVSLEDGTAIEASVDELYFVRIWRPHPQEAWKADSPTRSSLPVLRELVGLTQHISAQIDSRLAGAGLLVVPASVIAAMKAQAGIPEDSDEDPFTDSLIDAMTTPIKDRDSASAIVPFIVTAPDEATEKFHHISFASQIDSESRALREEAIERLAIGQDAPPELLLGTGGMNHWGAWLVREDVVTTHLEPPLALICDALTSQWLQPAMRALGYPEEQVARTVIWYDIDHLIVQPTRVEDAERMYDKGLIDDATMRDIAGFDESAAPEIREVDQAVELALDLVRAAPSLVASPGLPQLVAQIRATLDGKDSTTIDAEDLEGMGGAPGAPTAATPSSDAPAPPTEGLPPATDGAGGPMEPPTEGGQ